MIILGLGYPNNGWFIMENPQKSYFSVDDFGGPPFWESAI
jgi:hypothetical protein